MSLVSARAAPLDEILELVPKTTRDIKAFRARNATAPKEAINMFLVARVVSGLPDDCEGDEDCWMVLNWSIEPDDPPPDRQWEAVLRNNLKAKVDRYNLVSSLALHFLHEH